MSERHDLHAYLATLLTLVVVFIGSMLLAAWYPDLIGKIESFGLGTITGGLIGVLRIPSARPIATTQAGDVNVLPRAADDPIPPLDPNPRPGDL